MKSATEHLTMNTKRHRELVPLIKSALAKADAAKLRAEMAVGGKAKLELAGGKAVDRLERITTDDA